MYLYIKGAIQPITFSIVFYIFSDKKRENENKPDMNSENLTKRK